MRRFERDSGTKAYRGINYTIQFLDSKKLWKESHNCGAVCERHCLTKLIVKLEGVKTANIVVDARNRDSSCVGATSLLRLSNSGCCQRRQSECTSPVNHVIRIDRQSIRRPRKASCWLAIKSRLLAIRRTLLSCYSSSLFFCIYIVFRFYCHYFVHN